MRSPHLAVVATSALVVPALLLLAGCSNPSETTASETPTPTFSPSAPTPTGELPAGGQALAEWAETALPQNAVGGSTALVRGTGTIGTSGASLDVAKEPAAWQVVLACESATGAALTVRIDGGTASEIPCARPGGPAVGATVVEWNGGSVEVDSTSNAVYVYEVHPRPGT